mmetsp:Transcript_7325/g.15248  ORF Transcript_7325/g.15248 Transcript_7325/m.15248 type:complete len:208 (-) Transcript_7325:1939-2562(-)
MSAVARRRMSLSSLRVSVVWALRHCLQLTNSTQYFRSSLQTLSMSARARVWRRSWSLPIARSPQLPVPASEMSSSPARLTSPSPPSARMNAARWLGGRRSARQVAPKFIQRARAPPSRTSTGGGTLSRVWSRSARLFSSSSAVKRCRQSSSPPSLKLRVSWSRVGPDGSVVSSAASVAALVVDGGIVEASSSPCPSPSAPSTTFSSN